MSNATAPEGLPRPSIRRSVAALFVFAPIITVLAYLSISAVTAYLAPSMLDIAPLSGVAAVVAGVIRIGMFIFAALLSLLTVVAVIFALRAVVNIIVTLRERRAPVVVAEPVTV